MAYGQSWPAVVMDDATATVTSSAITTANGSTVVVFVASNSLTFAAGQITDSKGNTYSFISNLTGPQFGYKCGVFYCENIAGGASHTISCANPDGAFIMLAVELTSMQTASFDVHGSATGTSTAPASGNVTTAATDTLVGMCLAEIGTATTQTAGTGFTKRIEGATAAFINAMLETKDAAAAGTNSASATLSASDGWVMRIAAFKESAGGGTPDLNVGWIGEAVVGGSTF